MSDSLYHDTPSIPAPLPQRRGRQGPSVLKEVRKHRSFASLRTIGALVLREMQTSHGRASGGYLWAIAEPVGGAQRDPAAAIKAVGEEIAAMLADLSGRKPADLIRDRRQKFLDMGSKSLVA